MLLGRNDRVEAAGDVDVAVSHLVSANEDLGAGRWRAELGSVEGSDVARTLGRCAEDAKNAEVLVDVHALLDGSIGPLTCERQDVGQGERR